MSSWLLNIKLDTNDCNKNCEMQFNQSRFEEILNIKKARLFQHNMSYEELVKDDIFSDDEMTL